MPYQINTGELVSFGLHMLTEACVVLKCKIRQASIIGKPISSKESNQGHLGLDFVIFLFCFVLF